MQKEMQCRDSTTKRNSNSHGRKEQAENAGFYQGKSYRRKKFCEFKCLKEIPEVFDELQLYNTYGPVLEEIDLRNHT
jgi:hypothetical protein